MRFFLTLAVMAACLCSQAAARECTKSEEKAALEIAPDLKSWDEVQRAYDRYRHCDDGAISQGFTESVTVLLAKKWDQLADLDGRARKSKGFRAFVLFHIDETADRANLKAIEVSATTDCPIESRSLCREMIERAQDK